MTALVIVDTDVWSEAFRRKSGEPSPERLLFGKLADDERVQMLGCIRQEILQGIRDKGQFGQVRAALHPYEDLGPTSAEYELAAEFYNLCRSRGIQGSGTDYLIAACSVTWEMPILTKDQDFTRYAVYLPITLLHA